MKVDIIAQVKPTRKMNLKNIVLQCSTEASLEDIKNSYRKLSKEYHPDILASKGLPEDIIKYSQERFNKITEAKDILIKKLSNKEERINDNKGKREGFTKNNSTFKHRFNDKKTNDYRTGEMCRNRSCDGVVKNDGNRRCSICGCINEDNFNINMSKSTLKGYNLLKSSQFSEAIVCFEKAIKLDDENSLCYYYRAIAYSKIKDNKKAIADLKISAKLGCEKAIDTLNKYNINFV